jgi:uncharacterized membrane protein YraQ (UPF0718 family)
MSRWLARSLVAVLAVVALFAWLGASALLEGGGAAGGLAELASTFTTLFLSLFIEAAPFLLLGSLASGLIEVFVDAAFIGRWLPRGRLRGVATAALLGSFFPVGQAGAVPLTRRLLRQGLPLSAGVTFLLAAPILNPIVIGSTLAAFSTGPMLWLRLGAAFVVATLTGLAFGGVVRPELALRPEARPRIAGGTGSQAPVSAPPDPAWRREMQRVLAITVDEFFEFGALLVAGALLAALLQMVVPQALLLAPGAGPLVSVAKLILLALLQSIGAASDAFSAWSLAGTFSTGALVAFLVAGPMVDLQHSLLCAGVFRGRALAALVALPLLLSLAVGIVINLLFNP